MVRKSELPFLAGMLSRLTLTSCKSSELDITIVAPPRYGGSSDMAALPLSIVRSGVRFVFPGGDLWVSAT